jgi:putative transcriptional regulator
MTTKKPSRITDELLKMAEAQHRLGLMDGESYRKITVRHLGDKTLATAEPISGEEIRTLREREHLSQAAFARYLNLTAGFVSQLERGTKQPKGPALALLNVIRRKGLEVIL